MADALLTVGCVHPRQLSCGIECLLSIFVPNISIALLKASFSWGTSGDVVGAVCILHIVDNEMNCRHL